MRENNEQIQTVMPAVKPPGRPFRKGEGGRPKQTNLKSAARAARTLARNSPAVAATVAKLAREGDLVAARLLLSLTQAKDRLVQFPMLEIRSQADVVNALNGLLMACSQGVLSPAESDSLAAVVIRLSQALADSELEGRVRKLEALTAGNLQ
jgi:hypothetical protein